MRVLPFGSVTFLVGLSASFPIPGSSQPVVGSSELASRGPAFFYVPVGGSGRVDASKATVLRKRITVSLVDVTLAQALKVLTRETGLQFVYSARVVPADQRVNLEATNLTLAAALTELLLDTELDVQLASGEQASLVRKPVPTARLDAGLQTGVVEGTVVRASGGTPVYGAQVSVVGTNLRTLTDAKGRFRLGNVAGGEVSLRVVAVGLRPITQVVRVGAPDLRVAMTESAIELDEVVVSGTPGAVAKRALGNAISTIDATAVTEQAPIPDLATLIATRAPGVSAQFATGVQGAAPRIRLRGANSFSLDDQPLLYIDGVRIDNRTATGPAIGGGQTVLGRVNDISPESIESIEIIKGPAAATLYGTEASNGVIQIITKKGRAAPRPQLTLTTSQGAEWFANAESRLSGNWGRDPATGQIITQNLVKQENDRGTPIWRSGHQQGYALDVTGGSEASQYYISATYDHNEGVDLNNLLRRFAGRINLTTTVSPSLTFNANLGVTSARADLPIENLGAFFVTRFGNPALKNTPVRGFLFAPPEATRQWQFYHQTNEHFIGGVQIQHRPTSWLSQHLTVGLDLSGEDNQTLMVKADDYLAQFFQGAMAAGSKIADRVNVTTNTVDYNGTVRVGRSTGVQSSSSVGFQYFRKLTRTTGARGTDFPALGLETVTATAVRQGSEDFIENITVGGYLQQQFSWRDRRFLTAAIRVDDNSAFGQNFDVVPYPKISGSWVLSEEGFWHVSFVDALKLRAALGASGQQPQQFAALRTYAPTTSGTGVGVVTPSAIGNPDLKPERGEEVELGFDASLFNQRIGLDFTYYHQKTRDALLLKNNAPSGGFPGQQWVNVGEILNRGVEVQLRGQVLTAHDVQLGLTANFTSNHNEILDLGGVTSAEFRVGDPIGSLYDRVVVSAELNSAGRAINLICDGGPGAARVPCSAAAPLLFVGQQQPKWEGSLAASLTLFSRFNLYGLVDTKRGARKVDAGYFALCGIVQVCRQNFFPQEYDPVIIAQMQSGGLYNSWRYPDASFVRLREISASYDLPRRWAEHVGAGRLAVRVAGRNLHTWHHSTSLDPETYRAGALNLRTDQESYPLMAQMVASVVVTF